MGKIERKYLAHFINTAEPGAAESYERLGRDLKRYTASMEAKVDTFQTILGQTDVVISGYRKKASVEPYFAEQGSALSARLQEIIDRNLVLDDLRTDIVEVRLWDGTAGVYPATKETAYIELIGYGGDAEGYQIPFTIHYTGEKTEGSFTLSTNTFTPD